MNWMPLIIARIPTFGNVLSDILMSFSTQKGTWRTPMEKTAPSLLFHPTFQNRKCSALTIDLSQRPIRQNHFWFRVAKIQVIQNWQVFQLVFLRDGFYRRLVFIIKRFILGL